MIPGTGWNPVRAKVATAALLATNRYATVRAGVAPRRKVYSLSKFRYRDMNQGAAGTCWVHAGVALAEFTARAKGYQPVPVARHLVGWFAKQSFEGGGNPSDGGSITDAVRAMTEPQGCGIADERFDPYSDDPRYLGRKPPQSAWDDAKGGYMVLPVPVRTKGEIKTLVDADHPVGLGIWWSAAWDGPTAFHSDPGDGEMGHALLVIGFAEPGVFDGNLWWQLQNWHGDIYPPLAPAQAAKVEGYQPVSPRATSDFWMSDSLLDYALRQGGTCETVSATDLTGDAARLLVPSAVGLLPL